jgi:hypothetical protein
MKTVFRSLAVSLLLLPAACNKTLDLGTFNFADVSYVLVSGTLENNAGTATIKAFRVVLDGTTLQDTVLPVPAIRVTILGTKYGPGDGDHRLSLTVTDQTTTPNVYAVGVITVEDHVSSSESHKVMLAPQTAELANGGTITYTFRF